MNQEIVQSLIGQINEAHGKCVSCSIKLAEVAVDSINSAREAGLYLSELEDLTPHGQWQPLFLNHGGENALIPFSSETGRRYMKLAAAMPNPIQKMPEGVRHLNDMLIATGVLNAPSGHGPQQSHLPRSPFQSLIKFSGEMQSCIAEWTKELPPEQWSPDLRVQVKSQLEPIVELYKSL